MTEQQDILSKISLLAKEQSDIDVVWLYGSRARNTSTNNSDYDLAIAFKTYPEDPVQRRLRPELLALEWNKVLKVELSIVDFCEAGIQLAYAIVSDNTPIYTGNNFRRMTEEQKVMSKWELDHLYHRKHYA